jgi:hypothetical protein
MPVHWKTDAAGSNPSLSHPGPGVRWRGITSVGGRGALPPPVHEDSGTSRACPKGAWRRGTVAKDHR